MSSIAPFFVSKLLQRVMQGVVSRLLPGLTAGFFLMASSASLALAADGFRVYFIDVEGGQSTLLVSPDGESLLIDTGFEGFGGRDAERIVAAAKDAGVKRIDYLVNTHFHGDHVGGVANLLERMEVGTFIDHGPSVENKAYPAPWQQGFEKAKHMVVQPGEKIPIKGLDVTVVVAGGRDISDTAAREMGHGAGAVNPYCAGIEERDPATGENPQSVGIVARFGEFRFADLGDITWDREMTLLCPNNKVGELDLYLTTHHGADSPKAIWGMSPRVAVQNNGARKGGDATGWTTLRASPELEDIWQLHFAMAAGGAANTADAQIANLTENDQGHHIKVTAQENGAFTVENPRNKFSRTYAAK